MTSDMYDESGDGIEVLLANPDNAQPIYRAATCLRRELEPLVCDSDQCAQP
jgi:hypothetical protein